MHDEGVPGVLAEAGQGRLQANSSSATYDETGVGFYARNATNSSYASTAAWSLAVELTFSSEVQVAQMLEAIVPLAEYVWTSEPATLGYKVMRRDNDPLTIMVLERYVDKDDAYLRVHRSSPPFLDFKGKLREWAPLVDGHSYNESMFLHVGPER